jgi:hypothetical protein
MNFCQLVFVGLVISLPSRNWAQDSNSGLETEAFSPASIEFFEREVRPLLLEHCSACHSTSVGKVKGGLSLDSHEAMIAGGESGASIVPGKPDESLLVEAIRRESFEMPPEKPLSEKDRLTIERWVAMGAPWPKTKSIAMDSADWQAQRTASHWAWQPIADVAPPNLAQDDWSMRPLDRFILAGLRAEHLTPVAKADSVALLRRLCFDLTGLPPTLEMSQEFKDLSDATTYERLVEQLLASPQLGVRWGRHWMDLMRYAETLGHEFDYPIHDAWHYRDSVVDAFNDDVSYRDIVEEHIAGDLLEQPRRHPISGVNQSLAATAWWWLGDSVHAPVDIKNDWAVRIDNQIDVFSKTFLGMTVACARCHDHKFDAIGAHDYYGLAGVIESSRREYTNTDPSGRIEKQQDRIVTALTDADARAREILAQVSREKLATWIDNYVTAMRQRAPDKRQTFGANSPLAPLNLLAIEESAEFAEQASGLRDHLQRLRESFESWEQQSELFADCSAGLPAGWAVNGIGHRDFEPEFDWFSNAIPMPSRQGIFSSQSLGPKQSLTLTSPNFNVTRTHVCIKLRGNATQSAVVVSNYFMQEFHNLLFGDLRKPIDQPHDAGWVIHSGNLNKYLGHSAYLSFEDKGKAWFELDSVRFADQPPPEEPHAFAVTLLSEPIASRDDLYNKLLDGLSASLTTALTQEPTSVEVVRALIKAAVETEIPFHELADLREDAQKLQQIDDATPAPTILLTTTEGTAHNAHIALRGNPHALGDEVPRGCLSNVSNAPTASLTSSGRLELAESLVSGQHPLTARVMVNRIWQHMMGRGLVATPDNLGVLGGRPSHPELLDYLSREFVQHDWSMKWLMREIALSQTYQLGSEIGDSQKELDAEGRLWSHRPVRRLSAEALRDAMLLTADSLDERLEGPSVRVFLTDKMTGRGRPGESGPMDGDNRRTTFIEVRRNFLNPFLMAFDFPMPSTSVGDRGASNVPAQALGLLNDPLVSILAERWAESSSHIADARQRARLMLQTAYAREPADAELENCLDFIGDDSDAWNELAHVLFNSKEFSFLK